MSWFFSAPAIALIAGALAFTAWAFVRSRALRLRHEALAAVPLPEPRENAELLLEATRALYHGTRFADGQPVLLPLYREACVADLSCTTDALRLRREEGGPAGGKVITIPLGWVEDALLLRAPAPLAGKELPMLRLRWRRGTAVLLTDLSLRGGPPELERLRREIHLRQGQGSALVQLRRFLEAPPVPGAGAGSGPGQGG